VDQDLFSALSIEERDVLYHLLARAVVVEPLSAALPASRTAGPPDPAARITHARQRPRHIASRSSNAARGN
jgi:hypothetical protein